MPKRKDTKTRKLTDLCEHPRQQALFGTPPEHEVEELAADIVKHDLQNPIEIISDGTIIKGHKRRLALEHLGHIEAPVIVRDDLDGDAAAQELELIDDNFIRRQLDPLGQIRCHLRRLELEKGVRWDQSNAAARSDLRSQLAERLGKSPRHVDRYLRVLEAPVAVQRAFQTGTVSLVNAGKVAGLEHDVQELIAARIAAGEDAQKVVAKYLKCSSPRHQTANQDHKAFITALDHWNARLRPRLEDIQPWGARPSNRRVLEKAAAMIEFLREFERANQRQPESADCEPRLNTDPVVAE